MMPLDRLDQEKAGGVPTHAGAGGYFFLCVAVFLAGLVPWPAQAQMRASQTPPAFGANFDGSVVIDPATGHPLIPPTEVEIAPQSLEPAAGENDQPAVSGGGKGLVPAGLPQVSSIDGPVTVQPQNVMMMMFQGLSRENGVVRFTVFLPGRGQNTALENLSTPYTCKNIPQIINHYLSATSGQGLYDYGLKLASAYYPTAIEDDKKEMARSFSASAMPAFMQARTVCQREGLE